MNFPEDAEIVVGLGIDKDDKLVIASYLDMVELEAFLEDCLDIVRTKSLSENFTLQ
jgi:hypothetical protein